MTAPDRSPAPGESRTLTWDELALETGASRVRLERLVDLRILQPRDDPPFRSGDVLRVAAVKALEDAGVPLEELGAAIASEQLSLGYLDYVAQPPLRLQQTYRELTSELGIPLELMERVYLAFGLPQFDPDALVRADDAEIIRHHKVFLANIDHTDALHAARLFGESLRRLAEYQVHFFHTRTEEIFRRAGVPEPLVLEVALREVGIHTGPLGEHLAVWLYRRHSETFATEHRVLHGEEALERAGIRSRAPASPPGIAFADISGYTAVTENLGDEAGVELPMRLATLVEQATARHGGRTVKWIGDGVELHFREPLRGVACLLELVEQTPRLAIPGAHAGLHAGPVIYEQGDFYGRTVNLAARIAAHAELGEVLVSDAVVESGKPDGVKFELRGAVEFKGIAEPVTVYRAHRA